MIYMLLMYAKQAKRFQNTGAQVLLSSRKAEQSKAPGAQILEPAALGQMFLLPLLRCVTLANSLNPLCLISSVKWR